MGSYAKVPLSQGRYALVDEDDFVRVTQWSWHFDGRYARGYPASGKEYLHRYIMQPKAGKVVDHINGDKLDCRRENMRVCTQSLNAANSRSRRPNKHGLEGVYFDKNAKRWRAEICVNYKKIALGTFKSPELAHAAYLTARNEYFGLLPEQTAQSPRIEQETATRCNSLTALLIMGMDRKQVD